MNSPSDRNWKNLAKVYRDKADGKHVTFKLPSMLKAYYKTWVKNSDIDAKQKSLGFDVEVLLGDLFCRRTSDIDDKLPPTNLANNNTNTISNPTSQNDHGDTFPMEEVDGDNDNERNNEKSIFVGTFQCCYMEIQPTEPQNQHCAWFPFCDKLNNECGGRQMKGCQFFKHQVQDLEYVNQMKHAKNKIKKDYKRRYMQARRKAQKEAREKESNKRQCQSNIQNA